jgi:hypothetical protein
LERGHVLEPFRVNEEGTGTTYFTNANIGKEFELSAIIKTSFACDQLITQNCILTAVHKLDIKI